MSEDKIELIALLSQDNMKFLQKVWVEEEKDEKKNQAIFPSNFFFFRWHLI